MSKIKGVCEVQIISKIIQDKSLNIVEKYNLADKYFNTPIYDESEQPTGYSTNQIIKFIQNHYSHYNTIPDKATILSNFPDFTFVDVNESESYLVNNLINEYKEELLTKVLMETNRIQREQGHKAADDYYLQHHIEFQDLPETEMLIDLVQDTKDRVDRYNEVNRDNNKAVISTGLKEFDDTIGGGFNTSEELVVVQGRSGQSKTFLLLKFLYSAWLSGRNVLLFEPEMSANVIGYRFDSLNGEGNLSNFGLIAGRKQNKDYSVYIDELHKHTNKFYYVNQKSPIFQGVPTVSKLKTLCEKHNIDIIGIDGIEIPDIVDERATKNTPTHEQLTNIYEDLLQMSMDLKIPVLTTVQAVRTSKDTVLDIDTVGGSYGITRKCTMMISIKKEEKQITLKVIKSRNKEIMTKDQGVTYIVDLDKGIWHYDNSTVIETTTKENFSNNNSIFRKKQTITNNIEDLI